jgi:hypothetical protein
MRWQVFAGPIAALSGALIGYHFTKLTIPSWFNKIITILILLLSLVDIDYCNYIGLMTGMVIFFISHSDNLFSVLLFHDFMEGVFIAGEDNIPFVCIFTLHDFVEAALIVYMCHEKVKNMEIDRTWLKITLIGNPLGQLIGGLVNVYVVSLLPIILLNIVNTCIQIFISMSLIFDLIR